MASLLSLPDDALLAVLECLTLSETRAAKGPVLPCARRRRRRRSCRQMLARGRCLPLSRQTYPSLVPARITYRHTVLALVCRRLRHLINGSARLHATMDLCIGPKKWRYYQPAEAQACRQQQLLRICALAAWLAEHAASSVRQLRLAVLGPYGSSPSDLREVAIAVEALLLQTSRPARGISSGLTALALAEHASFALASPPTLAALSNLQRLVLTTSDYRLDWSLPAGSLPRLQQLSLRGRPLVVAEKAHFPPTLTRLSLSHKGIGDVKMPAQVQQLTGLHTIGLHRFDLPMGAELPASLRRLDMREVQYMGTTLSRLTALESLVLFEIDDDCIYPHAAYMRSLRSLVCLQGSSIPPLAGPMLNSLECLVVEAKWAVNNVAALLAATRLQTLGLVDTYELDERSGVWLDALRLPPLLPTLRHLALGGRTWQLTNIVQPIVDLQRRMPLLDISCHFSEEECFEAVLSLAARCGLDRVWMDTEFEDFIV